jgi:hypothetical protein
VILHSILLFLAVYEQTRQIVDLVLLYKENHRNHLCLCFQACKPEIADYLDNLEQALRFHES